MFRKKIAILTLPLLASLSLHASSPFNDPFFNDPFGDDIFKEMMQMQKNMDKMFNRMQQRKQQRSSGLISPLGTYKMSVPSQFVDKNDHYELMTNIPQSKENHINIDTSNGMMSITAKIIHEDEQKNGNMVSKSSSVRMYQQSVKLPNDVDESTITTVYKNGKLLISIEKKKGTVKANSVKINGIVHTIKTQKKQATPAPAKDIQTISVENNNTSKTKESNSTIKKEIIHSDKNSMS